MNATRTVEGKTYVIDGSTTCPSPALCDKRQDESYDAYVTRHLLDHGIDYQFADPEDAERNLGVNCFFFYHKWVQGNQSLGTGDAIVADYEPCWEDHEFLANDTFHPDDLEQNAPWDQRIFRLRPAAERRADGVRKRKKKLTKVRGTQKTSVVKALITFKHLRAYFVEGRSDYRMICISADRGTARDNYFDPIRQLWESTEGNLFRLYGTVEYTKRHGELVARRKKWDETSDVRLYVSDEALEAETRKVCLLSRGSKASTDRMKLRWNIKQKDFSGKTAVSLRIVGVLGSSTGGRWDFIVCDDVVVLKNVRTEGGRGRVKEVVNELRMQQSGDCEVVYINTPFRKDDASAEIDNAQNADYHILYRPAMWYDAATKEPRYYWQRAASCSTFPEGEFYWTPERVANERRSNSHFWSQVMLRLRDESTQLFKDADFKLCAAAEAPIEIRAGLGGAPVSERDRAFMDREGIRVRGFTFHDTADDTQRLAGDDSVEISLRFDRWGNIYFTHADGGRWNTEEEMEKIYEGATFNESERIEIETSGALEKWVRSSYIDFQRRKALELGRPITMPIIFENASKTKMSKDERIDRFYSFTSTGRVFFLSTVPDEIREKIKRQFIYRGEEPHDDFADAASRVVPYAARIPRKEVPKEMQVEARQPEPGHARVRVKDLLAALDAGDQSASNWGARRSA